MLSDLYKEIIEKSICAVKETIRHYPLSVLTSGSGAMAFRTIRLDLGRRSGKKQFLSGIDEEGTLIVFPTKNYLEHVRRKKHSIQISVDCISNLDGKWFNRIYIMNDRFINMEKIYDQLAMPDPDQLFIVLG